MESLLDQDDWMFPWEGMDMGSQQGLTSGLPDLSSACFESPWLEGIDGLQSTILLSNSAVDRKGDFSLFDSFHQSVALPEVLFSDADYNNSYVDIIPSMSPESHSFTPREVYEKGFQFTDYHSSSSPDYISPSPLFNSLSPGYSSPPTIHPSPSLEYAPSQLSFTDYPIKSPMALNYEDSDILDAFVDENYTLIAPESELLPVCDPLSDEKPHLLPPVFKLYQKSSSPSIFVQEVPQEPELEFEEEAQIEDTDPVEDQETVWMRNILEELMVAPELLSPVSSDDVDSILSGDSLNTAHQALQLMFSKKNVQTTPLVVPAPILSVPSDFVSVLDMNPSSCESASSSSFDGYMESVLLVSTNKKYNRYHSNVPYAKSERRIKKKEQNKTAALRYRHKKREQKGVVLTEVEQLELRNEELKNRAADLTREINYLKGLMDEICKT